jgi:protein-S-isoprenylcysteine O-methyltransferase Ste14
MSNLKAIILSYIGVLAFSLIIFIAGGRLFYWQAILYVLIALIGTTISHLLSPKGSNLATERVTRVHEGVKWDRLLLKLLFLSNIITFIVAGLDSGRFGWSVHVPMVVTALGAALMIIGQTLFAVAKRANSFFYSTVRIDSEKKHTVCETSVYSVIRHPGYLGMIISVIGFPLLLHSYWAYIPVSISVSILVLRAFWEDGFLKDKLEGYEDYALKTRKLLIPGVI